MPFASMVSDDNANNEKFEEWLTSERIEECKRNALLITQKIMSVI